MGFLSRDIRTMDELFVHTLGDIYYAEQEIVKALPTMIEKATNPQLRFGLEQHLAETRNHVRRVEEVFQMHGVEPRTVNSPAIDGIIEEADDIAGDVDDKEVLDAALIAAGRGTL
jgi:ferritin-like metal-binding protein YciE